MQAGLEDLNKAISWFNALGDHKAADCLRCFVYDAYDYDLNLRARLNSEAEIHVLIAAQDRTQKSPRAIEQLCACLARAVDDIARNENGDVRGFDAVIDKLGLDGFHIAEVRKVCVGVV